MDKAIFGNVYFGVVWILWLYQRLFKNYSKKCRKNVEKSRKNVAEKYKAFKQLFKSRVNTINEMKNKYFKE